MDCINIKSGTSLVRVFHAVPKAPPVDVYINTNLAISDLGYKEFSNYKVLEQGEYRFDIFLAGDKTKPIISGSLDLEPGNIFTIAAIGDLENLELLIINDNADKRANEEKTTFRIINLSPNTPQIDVFINETDLVENLEYKQNTSYLDIKPNKYQFDIANSDDEEVILSFGANLKADRIYTLYIVGNSPNLEAIQSVDGNTLLCKDDA